MQKIGVATAAAVGLGAIIGAGIFVLSGTAIALAGADALVAFVIVGTSLDNCTRAWGARLANAHGQGRIILIHVCRLSAASSGS